MKIQLSTEKIVLFFVSFLVISTQVVLIQYFAYQQWYNFAAVIISLALLGFGISGILIPKLLKSKIFEVQNLILKILVIAGLVIPFTILFEQNIIGKFDSYLLFFDVNQTIKFFLVTILFAIPFTTLALIIGLIFTISSEKISSLYFFNLIGSGAGGFFVVYLLWVFEPLQIYFLNGLLLSSLGIIISLIGKNLKSRSFFLFASAGVLINLFLFIYSPDNEPSQFKTLSRIKNFPDSKIVLEKNSPYGKVEILESSLLRYSPGLSLNFTDYIPSGRAIFLNAEFAGFELGDTNSFNKNFLFQSTVFSPFVLGKFSNVLVLNASGGFELQRVLISNFEKIYVTEKNPILLNLISKQIDCGYLDKVYLIDKDPRIFLEATEKNFNLIFHPVIEPVGYSSGLYSTQEKFLFTSEAFQTIYDKLSENGLFTISCYIDNPLRTFPKLLNTLLQIKNIDGSNISIEQVIAINNWNVVTILLKKGLFNTEELSKIEEFAKSNQFDFLIHPLNYRKLMYNSVFDSQSLHLIDAILRNDVDYIKNYPFKIEYNNDNNPYFSNFISPAYFNLYLEQISIRSLTYAEIGYFLIWLSFFLILVLSMLILLGGYKFVKINVRKLRLDLLVYFSTIGLAFMLVELSLIQKFVLVFSNDVFAISFVISMILVSSGAGSLFSKILVKFKLTTVIIPVTVSLLLGLFLIISDEVLNIIILFHGIKKFIFSTLLIFPIGFVMGMVFPIGIRKFSAIDNNSVPFAWAVNGSFSVLGSVGAVILLVNFGFDFTFFVAVALYFCLGVYVLMRKIYHGYNTMSL